MATYAADYVAERSLALGAKTTLLERTIDFAQVAAYRAGAGLTALASGDVYELFNLPAKTLVFRVGYDVTVAEGATATFDLGDGSDTDGYLNDISLNSVASGVMTLALTDASPGVTVTAYSGGKYYSSADTIDMVLNNNSIDVAVVRVWIVVQDCA
jgi:hypothetical protein